MKSELLKFQGTLFFRINAAQPPAIMRGGKVDFRCFFAFNGKRLRREVSLEMNR